MKSQIANCKLQTNVPGQGAPAHLPAREVMAMTGWHPEYLRKLRVLKVLRVFQPSKRVRPLYFREQIEQMMR